MFTNINVTYLQMNNSQCRTSSAIQRVTSHHIPRCHSMTRQVVSQKFCPDIFLPVELVHIVPTLVSNQRTQVDRPQQLGYWTKEPHATDLGHKQGSISCRITLTRKSTTQAVNCLEKCSRGCFNEIPQYLRHLNLLPRNPTSVPEISQIEPGSEQYPKVGIPPAA